jgi:hypothetical protein
MCCGDAARVCTFDRRNRWTAITGLPSLNVTALAGSEGTIYVGTDNGWYGFRKKAATIASAYICPDAIDDACGITGRWQGANSARQGAARSQDLSLEEMEITVQIDMAMRA